MINVLGLDAALINEEKKIAQAKGTAQLLHSSVSCTAYIMPFTGLGKERVERKKRKEERGMKSFLYTDNFDPCKNTP